MQCEDRSGTLGMIFIVKALFGNFDVVIGEMPEESFGLSFGSGVIIIMKESGYALNQLLTAGKQPAVGRRKGFI